MKKIVFTMLLAIILGGVCYFLLTKDVGDKKSRDLGEKLESPIQEDEVKKQLDAMSLEEKIGQMLIIDLQKSNIGEDDINLLKEIKPGGFILFGPNFTTYDETINLIKTIKNTSDIPMFISIDEEGGRVQRTTSLTDYNVAYIPPMLEVGNLKDEKLAYEIGTIIGKKLNVFGINMDFAPVIDIFSNPNNTVIGNRAFGTDSNTVYKMAHNVALGLEKQNIISVYKHFPGHGDTTADSHYELPVVTKTIEELEDLELKPFQDAIDNGAEVIMIAHLAIPNIASDNTPSSLSKEIITDLLKNKMGYKNLVITDSLKMKAIMDNYSERDIYKMAINAGVDILLMPENPSNAISLIKQMVETGEIKEEDINNSVLKILRLKELKIKENYNSYLDKEYLNHKDYEEVLNRFN